ncbi:hypothetical protein AAUPMC_08212, partial [Pasteurella multocida subsp. multocida str. Anand1_cattle]
ADELARQKAEELARKAAEEAKRYAELSEEDAENENSEDYADYHLTSTYAREAEDEEARRKENRNRGGKIKLPKRKKVVVKTKAQKQNVNLIVVIRKMAKWVKVSMRKKAVPYNKPLLNLLKP